MNFEEELDRVHGFVFERTGKRLVETDLQRDILRGLWQGMTYDDIAEVYNCNRSHVGAVLKKIYQLVSEALGEQVKYDNFREVIERTWRGEQRGENSSPQEPIINRVRQSASGLILIGRSYEKAKPRQDWGEVPDVSTFYGRTEELATLEEWIVNKRCRLVALLGIGGIGKTALLVRLAQRIHNDFEYVIWRSLRYSPPLTVLLADLIQFLDDAPETNLSVTDVSSVPQLIKFLKKYRTLVVLDEVEKILCPGKPAGHYREGYEDYGELFKQVGEVNHQSCLLLTSRETPRDVAIRQGEDLPVRVQQLHGLNYVEARNILRARGLSEEDKWTELITLYQGNPLWLIRVSTTIREVYGNSVSEFLNNSLYLDCFEELLDEEFTHLLELEKKIMYQLAIYQKPLSFYQLRENLQLQSSSELVKALESLGRRSLLEQVKAKNQTLFTLQPVLAKYVTKQYLHS